jgi:hypothetical protein
VTFCSLIRTRFLPPSLEQTYALSVQAVVLPKREQPRISVCGLARQNATIKTFVCTPLSYSSGLGDVMCL